MLRLQKCILTRLLSSSAASPVSPLHRVLSTAAAADSPNPSFAVEQYLVHTCGLTRAQALKASSKLSHLNSPSNPDAVLAFLAGLGLSSSAVAAAVARDPRLLCARVERTLVSNVAGLTGLGLTPTEVARLVSLDPYKFRSRYIVSKVQYYLPLFGSSDKLLRAIKYSSNVLSSSIEKVVKRNVAFLQECGLGACEIAKLSIAMPRILTNSPERVRAMANCAEGLGLSRGSPMFRHALHAVTYLNKEKIAAKVDYLKNTFRWSDAEVGIAVSKLPFLLLKSKEMLQHRSKFLINEVGLEPAYIARRPTLLSLSLDGRLKPRYYAVKFLKENGMLDPSRDYYHAVSVTEKVFVEKYIIPHDEAAPHLAEDYAVACRGEVPARFIFP